MEPEWSQFAYMYFELFESIFASYVDFPVIRVKSDANATLTAAGGMTFAQMSSRGANTRNTKSVMGRFKKPENMYQLAR